MSFEASDLFKMPRSETYQVSDILEKVLTRGEWQLYLPSFQREFVWDVDDIKKFFESILSGYPIGTIILWEVPKPDVDAFSLPLINYKESADENETYYVIDGQQRLTSLMLLACGWKVQRENKTYEIQPISFNLSNSRLYIGSRRGVDLYRGVKYYFYGDIFERDAIIEEIGRERFNRYIDIIKKLMNYKIPIYIIRTKKHDSEVINKMADIFILVNKAGQRIRNIELLLSYTAGILSQEIASIIRKHKDEIETKYSARMDIRPYLRYMFGTVLGLRQQVISNVRRFEKAMKDLRKQKDLYGEFILVSRIKDGYPYFRRMLELIKNVFGRAAIDLLPSHLSLIPVATYMYQNKIEKLEDIAADVKQQIKKWIILVNFNGYYTASPDTRLQKDIETVKSSRIFPYDDLRSNIEKYRPSAIFITKESIYDGIGRDVRLKQNLNYLFLLYIALIDNNAGDFSGYELKALKISDLHKHHIFPRDQMKEILFGSKTVSEEELTRKGVNGLGNITLIKSNVNSEISERHPFEYLREYERELVGHFIPQNPILWNYKNFEKFIQTRIESIYRFLKNKYIDIIK